MTAPSAALEISGRASGLARALPPLLVEAQKIAATVIMGVHGRRRAGPGESFWQYRPYSFGDSTQRIDWHKSARAERVMIRENEWEAANTLWIFADAAPGMNWRSHLSTSTKRERAQLLSLAVAELALKAHERTSALGSPFLPAHARSALIRIADWWQQGLQPQGLPEPGRLSRHSAVALFSDFLEPPDQIARWLSSLAARGAVGHLVQVCDPAEETLPWNGRVEFHEMAGPRRYIAGRTESIRADYREKFLNQRAAVREAARRLGWSFLVHRTDEPPVKTLMHLHAAIGGAKSRLARGA